MKGPILILGMQGAGKSTLGRLIAEATGATHLSAGTLLRLHEREGGRYAREIRERLDRGEGVTTGISYGLLEEAICDLDDASQLVLDGYPRKVSQNLLLRRTIGADPARVLLLNIPRPLAIDRILNREVCDSCDAAFGRDLPPRVPGVCDRCGEVLSQRRDDSPAAVAKRLDGWSNYSRAIITHYDAEGILCEIDASRPIDEVLGSAIAEIEESIRN